MGSSCGFGTSNESLERTNSYLVRGFASKWIFAVSVVAVLLVSCFAVAGFMPARTAAAATTQNVTIQGTYHQTEARSMLGLVNGFRTNKITSKYNGDEPWYWNESNSKRVECKNLGKLTWDYSLEKIAMQRAAEVSAVFSHTRPNGSLCFTAKDGSVQTWGENIAFGLGFYDGAESVFVGWREDNDKYSGQGHRRNMLDSDFTSFAAACFEVDGAYFWVQEFGFSNSGSSSFAGDNAKKNVQVSVNSGNEELSYGLDSASTSVSAGKEFALPGKLTGFFEPWMGVEVPFSVEGSPSWKVKSGSSCVSSVGGASYKAVAAGTAVFEASALGKTATYTVKVSRLKSSISGLVASKSVKAGESFALKATTNSDAKIVWSSSNPAVATVDGSGNVTAKAAGSATIKASVAQTSTHEAASATCKVTVANPAPAVVPSKPSGDQSASKPSGDQSTTKPSTPSTKPESPKPAATPTKPATTKVSAPKGTTLAKVTAAKKAFTAKWKKGSGIAGYQLRWSTKSSMKSAKSTTVKSVKTTSKKVTKLKKKTKYYVQVRTYKVVKGKTYWSGWSKAKSVKTK